MKLSNISKVLIQGIKTVQGTYLASLLLPQGTPIVAGVSPGFGSQTLEDIPIYDLVEQAIQAQGHLDISLICVIPDQVLEASLEAITCGIRQLIIFSKGVPPLDMMELLRIAKQTGTFILGSGSQGLLIPNQLYLGSHDYHYYLPGSVAIISRLDRFMDEVALILTQANIGQSLSVCLGTDRLLGSSFEQWLDFLENDHLTKVILLLGIAHGQEEINAAQYIVTASRNTKPVILYLAGLAVSPENISSQFSSSLSDSSHLWPFTDSSSWLKSLTALEISTVSSLGDLTTTINHKLQHF